MRGRKPKNLRQQLAEGDPRKHGKRKLQERLDSEPRAFSGLPECPEHLTGRAEWAWNFWAEQLAVMKLDKRPDGPMLEGACIAYARAVDADLIIKTEGLLVYEKFIDDSGEVIVLKTKKHPAVDISNRAWLLVKGFCSEFGLSPVSRTRLSVEKQQSDEDSEIMKALAEPRSRTSMVQ